MASTQILSAALSLIAAHDLAVADYREACAEDRRAGYRASHCFHGTRMVWADDRDAMCHACESGEEYGYVNEYSARGVVMVWALATAHENERARMEALGARADGLRAARRAINVRTATLWELLGTYPKMSDLIDPELESLDSQLDIIREELQTIAGEITR